ncbi:TM2 domain-containing protein [Leadbettera azotonutricia]|uniref:TM2 domain protein n=1 Tax=Leadbettera azotonutricia (strain ATCC BAA-888 / DSM 13862 / ZAS-9) TaxID=545695 RepID=F5Y8A3_LEAAZ|nr:NINE protein [Leadbettera azotonutricia]AEF80416.1 TM2 domain protein [Leadbettera azotonutricia ZAS-9]
MYSVGIAYLLWLLSGFGALGFHRFYLGKIPTGLLWMFTGGLGMVGSIYDFFTLGSQVREANIRNAIFSRGQRRETSGSNWRVVEDGEARVVHGKPGEKESLERIILKLAKENRGILTVSEVALAADISVDSAKNDLDALVSKGIAELRVRKTGTLVYVIPEIMDRDEPLEDF